MGKSKTFTLTTLSRAQYGRFGTCLFSSIEVNDKVVFDNMEKNLALTTEEDSIVDLSFHSIPASLLNEFAEKICKPYYHEKTGIIIKDSILSANAKHELILSCTNHAESEDNG